MRSTRGDRNPYYHQRRGWWCVMSRKGIPAHSRIWIPGIFLPHLSRERELGVQRPFVLPHTSLVRESWESSGLLFFKFLSVNAPFALRSRSMVDQFEWKQKNLKIKVVQILAVTFWFKLIERWGRSLSSKSVRFGLFSVFLSFFLFLWWLLTVWTHFLPRNSLSSLLQYDAFSQFHCQPF